MFAEKGMNRLNLGCGDDIRKDCINVDFVEKPGVTKVNLNKYPWPFKENTFDEVIAFNILEHLNDTNLVFDELRRICKNGAIIHITAPHFSSGNAWGNIEHRKPFSMQAFRTYTITNKFDIIKMKLNFPLWKKPVEWLANRLRGFYEYHLAYIFTSDDLYVKLRVKK